MTYTLPDISVYSDITTRRMTTVNGRYATRQQQVLDGLQ